VLEINEISKKLRECVEESSIETLEILTKKASRLCERPRVSIGLPVFNGEKYIKQTLDSILTQTFNDFELIISDNASSDETPQICREYVANDKRIYYIRNKSNLGAAWNHNLVFRLSSSKYFKWISHDDVLAPEYLSKCVNVLDNDPTVVLCHSKTRCIDKDSKLIRLLGRESFDFNLRFASSKPYVRFGEIINMQYRSWIFIFGVIRAKALKKTRLFGNYHSADRNLLSELSLLGRLYEIPEYLFFWRQHSEQYTNRVFSSDRKQLAWWTNIGKVIFPHWRILIEYFRSVKQVPLDWLQKLFCYAQICRWFLTEGWYRMGRDIVIKLLDRPYLGPELDIAVLSLIHKLKKISCI